MSLELVTSPESDVDTIELFKLDGVSYSIPKKTRVNLQLKFIRKVRKEGDTVAGAWLIEELIGEEGFTALSEYEELKKEDFDAVLKAARMVVFGETEADLKNR